MKAIWQETLQQPAWRVWSACGTASLLVTLIAYWSVVQPLHQRQAQAALHSRELASATAQADADQSRLTELALESQNLMQNAQRLPAMLGDQRQLNERVAELILQARQVGLEVLQVQPGVGQAADFYQQIPVHLEVVGTQSQHLALLDLLHTEHPDLMVHDLSITPMAGGARATPASTLVAELLWFTALPEITAPLTSTRR